MKYRYSLVDDDSDLIIGYCNKVDGLTGKIIEKDNNFYHKVVLCDFIFCNEFKDYLITKKERFGGLVYINILDENMEIIANFNFTNYACIKHTEFYKLKSHIDLKMLGFLTEIASKNELRLWNQWIFDFPKEKNMWVNLDYNGRRDWLRMLRIAHCCKYKKFKENTNKIFYLDGRNITSYESFFIAFAEAMNGAGTYFGSCIAGLDDCLCGGFGITPPFKLIWNNSLIALKNLDENEWKNHRSYLKKLSKKTLDNGIDDIVLNSNIFYNIMDTLLSHDIEVILIP